MAFVFLVEYFYEYVQRLGRSEGLEVESIVVAKFAQLLLALGAGELSRKYILSVAAVGYAYAQAFRQAEHEQQMDILGCGRVVEFADEVLNELVHVAVLHRVRECEHEHLGDEECDGLPTDVGIDLLGQVERIDGSECRDRAGRVEVVGEFDDRQRLVGSPNLVLAHCAIDLQAQAAFGLTVHVQHRHLVGVLAQT